MKTEKSFQRDVIANILTHFNTAHAAYGRVGQDKGTVKQVRAEQSAVLLEAPTGVGKTYMAARVIGRFSQHKKMLWFWFSPWEHLANQTEAALVQDGHGLRVADLSSERHSAALTGSRVYSLVWASLAARADVKRKTRDADDGKQDLDSFIEAARARGFRIGIVVDEAHHGISGVTEAARLVKETLSPDYHLFVTATPDDKDLNALQHYMGISRIRREVATRADGIAARLIKPEVKVVYFEEKDDTAGYLSRGVSLERGVIAKAVAHHESLKIEIAKLPGVRLTPLLLVQVSSATDDAEATAKAALIAAGMAEASIRTHTANTPDRNLQKIASDQSVEALIFKMAVGTGFDAPRAFTLVSLRSSRKEQFGLQVLGRILRVHSTLQALPSIPLALREGVVFLVDKTSQDGLASAADRIKSIQRGVAEFCVTGPVVDGQTGEVVDGIQRYPLQLTLSVPELFTQTNTRQVTDADDLEQELAGSVHIDPALMEAALRDEVAFKTTAISVFDAARSVSTFGDGLEAVNFQEIARKAIAVLGAIPETNLQLLLLALHARMKSEFRAAGNEQSDSDRILHAVYLLGQTQPRNPVLDAWRAQIAWVRGREVTSPLPSALESLDVLPVAARNLYGVMPDGQWDSPDERRFALARLEDEEAPVVWWHRNPPRKSFSVGLAKPGGMFYPDFLVKLSDLSTKDSLALIEVKGEGWLGDAKVKADTATRHPDYGRPIFVVEVQGIWRFLNLDTEQLEIGDRFTWKGLRARVL